MDIEKISLMAQKISFAFEDLYADKEKREIFNALFNKYLSQFDPSGVMEPYDAIILLGRKNPEEFDRMIQEMKEISLITD
jgi:hypothetical protein